MHEVTESYQGALISQENRVSSGNSRESNDIYLEAHGKATPQSEIKMFLYDKNGRKTREQKEAVKMEVVVINPHNKKNKTKVILTIP